MHPFYSKITSEVKELTLWIWWLQKGKVKPGQGHSKEYDAALVSLRSNTATWSNPFLPGPICMSTQYFRACKEGTWTAICI